TSTSIPPHSAVLAQPAVQLIDVMDDQPAKPKAHSSADNADGHAVAEENAGHALRGCADALDDPDVARLLDDDHVENAEDQEDGDDADEGKEDRTQTL